MSQPLVFDIQVDNRQAVDSINAFFSLYEKGVDGMAQAMSEALGKPVEKKVTIEMEGDKLVAKEIDKVSDAVSKIEAATKAVNGEFGKTPNEIKRQLAVLKAVQGETVQYKSGTKELTNEWKALAEIIKKLQAILADMSKTSGGVDLTDKLISSQIAADALMGTFHLLTDAVGSFVRTGADMEVLFIQLQGFTGGVQEAADAYQRFVEIGQATPFSAREVAVAARTMMGFGIETDQAIDQVERLAIVASATGGELTHMARNMGQIQANQKAYTRDLMQFANQGIPIYQEMAKLMDTSTERIRKMAEEGKIGFGLVSAALRNLTRDGSNLATIAELMDATFAAKMEAMGSAVESFAGRFMAALNSFDAAIGGPLSNSLQTVINLLNSMGEGLTWVSQNMRTMAPIIGSLVGAMTTLIALTIAQNWSAFVASIKAIAVATKLWTLATKALVVVKATLAALTGNIPAILAAAGVAAGAAAIAYNTLGKSIDKLNQEEEKHSFQMAKTIDDIDETVFALKTEKKAIDDLIDAERERYTEAKEGYDIAKQKAQDAVTWIRQEYEAFVDSQKEERQLIKDKQSEERTGHQERMRNIREYYDEAISDERELLEKIRERYALERDQINEKSGAELALEKIRRRELELKAKGIDYSRSAAEEARIERLEAQASLDRLDRSVKLEKNRANEKKAVASQEKKITEIQKDKDRVVDAEKELHSLRMDQFKKRVAELDMEKQKELDKVEEAEKAYDSMFKTVQSAQYSTHREAMSYIQTQINEAGRLGNAMVNAANRALAAWQKANAEAAKNQQQQNASNVNPGTQSRNDRRGTSFRFAGGPMFGGQEAIVNELGQEAFLSAKGKLSLINAPSFGTWRAPSAGTVIPAHLTSQLNIPAGGININSNPAMNAAGSTNSIARAISGISGASNINNSVTIQSANPTQTANNMLVQLQKIRSARIRRR